MIITENEYNDFRNRVLAKTDGTNIHRVNGLLALVMDWNRHEQKSREKNDMEDIDYCNFRVRNALTEIKQLTTVSL